MFNTFQKFGWHFSFFHCSKRVMEWFVERSSSGKPMEIANLVADSPSSMVCSVCSITLRATLIACFMRFIPPTAPTLWVGLIKRILKIYHQETFLMKIVVPVHYHGIEGRFPVFIGATAVTDGTVALLVLADGTARLHGIQRRSFLVIQYPPGCGMWDWSDSIELK